MRTSILMGDMEYIMGDIDIYLDEWGVDIP